MPRIATRHVHKLAYRRRLSLGVRMLGCLILLAGAMVLAAALAEIAKGALSRPGWLMIGFGAVLFICGAILFCGEYGKLLDRESRTLLCWWGVIVPLRRTFYDLQSYQAVGVQGCPGVEFNHWRVCLWNAQGERLDLFEMTGEDVARLAARQIAAFLSLAIAPPPAGDAVAPAAISAPAAVADRAPTPTAVVLEGGGRWMHREPYGLAARGLGVVLLTFGFLLLAGLLTSGNAESRRWPQALAVTTPLGLLGLWFLLGCRRVVVDAAEQSISVWSAWPLPPAVYDLASFYAVVVAPMTEESQAEPAAYLVGLIGPEQVRLELLRALPCDKARAAAAQLAAAATLPLIDESQVAPTPPPASTVP